MVLTSMDASGPAWLRDIRPLTSVVVVDSDSAVDRKEEKTFRDECIRTVEVRDTTQAVACLVVKSIIAEKIFTAALVGRRVFLLQDSC